MKTPSKHSSLEFLKALKSDNFLSKVSGEYSEEETELLINQKLDSIMNKAVDEYEKQMLKAA